MDKKRIVLCTAGLSLAISLMLGCAGPKTVSDIKGDEEVISIRNELQELCNKEYIEQNFCGIGQGKSNSESVAAQIASTQARSELAGSVQTMIEAKTKTFALNDPDGQALEGAAMRAIANVSNEIVDIRTQKVRTMYNKEDKQFTVYTLLTSSRSAALELAKQKLRSSQEIEQIQRTLTASVNIDRILD
ncbi:MAG: hypothetical protein FWB90_05615 [Fibromonadales bacterium]|nr:hypothetical protein [Fibromonadales bacterium]